MEFKQKNILKNYPFLKSKNQLFIVSSNYEGLICASFLHHYFGWSLEGFYDLKSLWLSNKAIKNKKDLVWVDLNILPETGKSVGGHIVSMTKGRVPKGFESSCNLNTMRQLTINDFRKKYPFSTILFFLWLHNIKIDSSFLGRLLILQADDVWLKIQKFNTNVKSWMELLQGYDWSMFIDEVSTRKFDQAVDMRLFPIISQINPSFNYGKMKSNFLKLRSRQIIVNPDWDEDVILNYFKLFAEHLGWSPPSIPTINKRVDGKSYKINIEEVEKIGLNRFIKKYKVFSYSFPSNRKISYTSFGKISSKK